MQVWVIVVIALVVLLIVWVTRHFIARQRKQIEEKELFAEQLQELVVRGEYPWVDGIKTNIKICLTPTGLM